MMYKGIALVILAGFTLWVTPRHAGAEVIEHSPEPPGQYEFAGKRASMTYTPSSPDGEAMLTYHRHSREPRHFKGDEVRVAETEMGQTATITLWSVSDLKTITLTLLIPSVNLDGTDPLQFETKSLITSHHTTIAGPDWVEGPLQTYLTGNLLALASHVEVPPEPGPGVFGKVTISPTCAGPQEPGQICIGPLSETAVQLLDQNDQIVETAITDQRGFFAIRSEPGDYFIQFDTGGMFPACPETSVTIPDGLVAVRVRCDTGIR